jgi:hypothetical protein
MFPTLDERIQGGGTHQPDRSASGQTRASPPYALPVNISDWLALGTFIVAVVGVVGGLMALRQGNRQQKLELGNLYIQRYWEIDDELLQLPKGSPEHRQSRHRYLRLCEDEFEAARRGWFDERQWSVWHEWLTKSRTAEMVASDLKSCDPETTRFDLVRACLTSGPGHSWEQCPVRRSRGNSIRYLDAA